MADSSQKKITHTIGLVFAVLVLAIIFNAFYSLRQADKDILNRLWHDTRVRLDIGQSVHRNQLEKLSIISLIAKEQNVRICEFMDYDNVDAINYMLGTMVSIHDIDFAMVINEDDELVVSTPKMPGDFQQNNIEYFIGDGEHGVSLMELPGTIGEQFLPGMVNESTPLYYLCLRAVIPLLHDTGDYYGFVVFIKVINGDTFLLNHMAELAESRVTYFDREGTVLISDAPPGNFPIPESTFTEQEQEEALAAMVPLVDQSGNKIGTLAVSSSSDSYFETRSKMFLGVFFPFIFTTFISIVLFFLLKYRVFDKVNRLSCGLRAVSKQDGDMSVRIETSGLTKSDEVESMLRDFNQMMDKLEDTSFQMQLARREAEKANHELEERVRERTEQLTELYKNLKIEMEDKEVAIEQQRELERSLERARKMESLGTLAGGIAHDLNNILSGIVSYPDLLLRQLPEDSNLRGPITTIKGSGEKAANIVQDLLTLTRRGVATFNPLSLNGVILEYMESPEYEKLNSFHQDFNVILEFDDGLPNILGSSTHLSKVIMNLVANAAEALNEKGIIKISTEVNTLEEPVMGYDSIEKGEYVTLVVSDNGVGIKKEELSKIFEPFFTRKKLGRSGTGLGMSVVWGCIEDHKGYITVESEEGYGTVFRIYLPVTDIQTDIERELNQEMLMGDGEFILVVDDVIEQREIASGMLQQLGYRAVAVSSGEAAIEFVEKNDVDLLLLDMLMPPGIDGLTTFEKIVATKPGQKALIASGFSETSRVKKAQGLGVSGYIRKPYKLHEIGAAIKNTLHGKSVNATEV